LTSKNRETTSDVSIAKTGDAKTAQTLTQIGQFAFLSDSRSLKEKDETMAAIAMIKMMIVWPGTIDRAKAAG
jgi:hypothetical protein